MTLLLTMLPVYLVANLHCLGMCGPLVMMIGAHRYRAFYFLGRTLSFTLAAMAAASVGSVFHHYHLSACASFLFGGMLLFSGSMTLLGYSFPVPVVLRPVQGALSLLMLKDQPLSVFLFGFFTIALPCGQTIIVLSACALAGDPYVGLVNGLAFALLTSPSLFFAMQAASLIRRFRGFYQPVMGLSALFVGALAILRGLAELQIVGHFSLNSTFHLVLF